MVDRRNLESVIKSDIIKILEDTAVKFNVEHKELKNYAKKLVVKLCDEGPQQYMNYIYIPMKFVGNKRAYVEEGMHFLRLYCSKQYDGQYDGVVQEFFAGIAVLLFCDEKNLVFWKESDEDVLLSLLEDKRVSKAMKEKVVYALDSMAGYGMANAFYKQGLIDKFLDTYPKIIYDSDREVVRKVLGFLN